MSRILSEVGFVHLHVHSSYSLLEGALKVADLAKLAAADRQPALALTDTNNLFGALEFSEKLAGSGIQPIAGVQLAVCFEEPDPVARVVPQPSNIVLLAQTEEGYRNLMRLVSHAYFGVPLGEDPRVMAPVLSAHSDGLIALTGGFSGPLDCALRNGGRQDLAQTRLDILKNAFGHQLYVEIQRHGLEDERLIEGELLALADRNGLPVVAANEPFFSSAKDYEAHDALLAIAEGQIVSNPDRRRLSPEHHFKTRRQMMELFADLPDALQASVEIAMRCATRVRTRKPILPNFGTGPDAASLDEGEELKRQAEEGLERRLAAHGPAPGLTEQDYRDRLAYEIGIIQNMKF